MNVKNSITSILIFIKKNIFGLLWTPKNAELRSLQFVTVTAKEKDGARWDKYALFEREPRPYSAI